MSRHMAAYWAQDGIRVNCLSPGAFPSPKAPGALIERLETKLPMKRMGTDASFVNSRALMGVRSTPINVLYRGGRTLLVWNLC